MERAKQIVNKLQKSGYKALFVGGCVRDMLLNVTPKDYDLVTNATPEQTLSLFKDTKLIGEAFGVVLIEGAYELAQFRDDLVDGTVAALDPTLSLKELINLDSSRRDFTIGAIYYDPITDKMFDPQGGVKDLEDRVLRFVGDGHTRIEEDPIRILRAYRFAMKYNTLLPSELVHSNQIPLLKNMAKERIFLEVTKILMSINTWEVDLFERFLDVLSVCVHRHFLEFVNQVQSPVWHPEGNLSKHTFGALKQLRVVTDVTVWATLLHDIGKVVSTTLKDGKIVSPLHANIGQDITRELLMKLKCSKKFIDEVTYIVGNHMRIKHVHEMKRSKVIAIMSHPFYENLKEVSCADSMSSTGNISWWNYLNAFVIPEHMEVTPLVNGNDLIGLGFTQGKNFKEMLSYCLEQQHDVGKCKQLLLDEVVEKFKEK